jgi:glycosyltransferase involved in cell wall biosynthesis/Tfp pilus assembly protein PilF
MSKSSKKSKPKSGPKSGDWSGRPPATSRPQLNFEEIDKLLPEEMSALFGTIQGTLQIPFPPNTLTIAMIVKNEAKNIREAIESFRPIADEIIVYDTGSTDGTLEILKTLDVRWVQGEWRNDFAWARNESIALAKSSWILWMDADDRLPKDQIPHFLKLKTAPLDRAFGFQVINTQAGLPFGGRFMQLRMFPNHPTMRFRYRIHEQILHSVAKLGLHCFFTETTIHHTGYEDPDLKKAKALRNLRLLEEEPERIAVEPSLSMSVGDSYYIIGDFASGIEAYKRTMAMPNCEKINRDIYFELPCCIGQGCQKLGRREEALTWFDQSIKFTPAKHEAYYHKAECLMEMGRNLEAEQLYAKLVTMPVSFSTTSNQFDLIQIYSHFHLATFLHGRRDFEGARKRLLKMQEKYPQVVEAWHLLGKCQMALGNNKAALESWTRAINLNARAIPEIHGQRLALLKHLGKHEEFLASLSMAKTAFPQAQFPEWTGRPRLSLCMIVKNEKENLPACLASAKDLADEIIVVDTGSTDGTQEIARTFGAKVIQSGWQGDFSLARNLSLSEAQGRWIVWLDADDRLLEKDKQAIRKLSDADPDAEPRAYGLLVKNTRDGGRTGSVFNQIRVFPNRPELKFRAPVHEQILPALEEAKIPVEYTSIHVLHTGYADAETSRTKQIRNKTILEAQIKNGQGITPVTYFTLANACSDLGEYAEAVNWFLKAGDTARSSGSNPHIAAAVPSKVAAALASLGKYTEAMTVLDSEIASGIPSAEAVLVKAQVEAALGHADQARPWFERLLSLQEARTFIPVDFQLLKIQALQFLGQYWFERNGRDLAVTLLKAGLAIKEGEDFTHLDLKATYQRFSVT